MSLVHLGGGNFLYSLPGRRFPVVGRIELWRKRNRSRALGFVALNFLFIGVMSLFSGSGTADPITDMRELRRLEEEGNIAELEARTEEIKGRIFSDAPEQTSDSGNVEIRQYRVRPGDTLSSIALRHRVPASLVAASSRIDVHSVLRVGQTLLIPDRPGLIYQFKPGDTLAAIAQHYSVRIDEVSRDNPDLASLDMIEPGTRVFLPNARIPIPPPQWLRPVRGGRVTSGFGWRRHPMLGTRHLHTGIDIAVYHQTVTAVRDGQVIFAGWLGSYGNAIVVRHESGYKSLYAHLSRIQVRPGQFVRAGGALGISGSTGASTGPHLHFELIRNGRPINPRLQIRF
ncbi:MAG: peptidoglycan DD-metalloendopeptidase family protein [Leptospiraceae bacterium]|nr:peptidoglycan DD-metalloendopeptidase family protein [Leptospiraceae bacterium]MCP5485949.1 peptidoglycan DD-metalloendopeptidase family protein [Spirochaetales bacterium]